MAEVVVKAVMMVCVQAGLLGVHPVQSCGGPELGLMLCYGHLEILTLWTRVSEFSFCTGPANFWVYLCGRRQEGVLFFFFNFICHSSSLFHFTVGHRNSLERQTSPCLPYHPEYSNHQTLYKGTN